MLLRPKDLLSLPALQVNSYSAAHRLFTKIRKQVQKPPAASITLEDVCTYLHCKPSDLLDNVASLLTANQP